MPVTSEWISTDGLDWISNMVTSEKRTDSKALRLDDRACPTFNWLVANAKSLHSVGGGYRMEVKGNRGQREEFWDGADELSFYNKAIPFPLKYFVGKGHYGNTNVYDFLERQGIRVGSYGDDTSSMGSPGAMEVVLNYLSEQYDDIAEDKKRDRARRVLTANDDAPKAYTGWDGLCPHDNNTTGTIGGADRSEPLLQHNLFTGINAANLWLTMTQAERTMTRYAAGATMRFNFCGDNFYDLLTQTYSPNANQTGFERGFDIRVGMEQAQQLAGKFKIGLPLNSFITPNGTLIVNDQILNDLDDMYSPSVPWSDRMISFTDHVCLYIERKDDHVMHPMPINQVVCYESWFNTMALAVKAPKSTATYILAQS